MILNLVVKKPSILSGEIKNLANCGIMNDILKTKWVQCLLQQTEAILFTSSEGVDGLAQMKSRED